MKKVKDAEINLSDGKAAQMPSTRKIYVLCTVIPFLLFWGGILSPLWTDNFILYVFALAPYYFYTFYLSNDWIEGKSLFMTSEGLYASKVWCISVVVCSVCSIASIFLLFELWNTFFFKPCLMLVLNAPMAIVWILYSNVADRFRYARPSPYFIA
ncbi:hypothetical protein SAMN05720487_11393 [Fibrobacter sp. UWT2]|uniref:hypothetical protein n=1 Tax=Fibrobacter sp. UWT2 TaxID=1896224 RepID=UPI00091B8BD6|nr:hypothetical protein [Fibrobacter sp. UWT2]SHL42060.1 hypothetical protein SAMN05720487_11393 [Fibrobacter sp. UWT2]